MGRNASWRPRHGTVVACVALFVALGGVGAYAAGRITSKDIARDAVKSRHIDNGQVRKADLAAGALAGVARQGEFAEQDAQVDVESSAFQERGGPQVTVTVGASGLISVYAEAEIKTDDNNPQLGTVGLFEDGNAFPGLSDCGGGGAALIKAPDNVGSFRRYTTGAPDVSTDNCAGRAKYGGPIVLHTTPGTHTYELRYVSGGDTVFNTSSFRNRMLLVTPVP